MTILVGIRTNVMEFCSRREIGFGSEYSMGKWEFVAKEQGGVNGWKLLRGNIKGKGSPVSRVCIYLQDKWLLGCKSGVNKKLILTR